MRIGIYGSSLDPITNGHLWSANTIAEREELDKVIFLPSSGKRIDKDISTSDHHRVEMLKLAIAGNALFDYSTYEMNAMPGRQHSFATMEHFKEVFPNDELFFLMGADLLADLPKWVHGEKLVKNTKFIVIERNNILMHKVLAEHPLLRRYERNFCMIYKGIVNETSSSYIREEFRYGRDPRYLLPESVYHYIKEKNIYPAYEE